ncbi:TetR/AcrR family transcriptional regulator [Alteromonadaceae bacterium BrNp21-10]|nr:TetR/AcrR family transcriptional regulator [Alteromonadaceae bacterium BrNp21-10]
MATPRKQVLIDTAYSLFNQHGYHATGIDKILAQSGVSKATLYKHFKSKEELILEVLRQRHELLNATLEKAIQENRSSHPALALFDALDNWFHSEDFYGCNFIRAGGEYPLNEDPIHRFSASHKDSIRQLLSHYLPEDQQHLASAFLLLADGAIIAAQIRGEKDAAKQAKMFARQLLNQ